MKSYRISQLIKSAGISRSTLLYYDRIGLLPAKRNQANYRIYDQAGYDRLQQIMTYRQAGLALEDIQKLLEDEAVKITAVLTHQLEHLNKEISELRKQQQLIVSLLGNKALLINCKTMTKAQWVNILKQSGMSEKDMEQWHIAFEQNKPEMHEDFLLSLGIPAEEVAEIRAASRA